MPSDPATPTAPPRPPIPRQRKLLYAAAITLFALVAIELTCRLILRLPAHPRWTHQQSVLRTLGFPALTGILEPDPDAFWRMRPDVPPTLITGRVAGFDLLFRISTDSRGHRSVPAVNQPAHTVLFLGDSCTLGIGVDDDGAFPALLQARLGGVRCINAGVPGYTAYQGRIVHARLPEARTAKVVIIAFGFNDHAVWDNRSDLEHAALRSEPSSWLEQTGTARLLRHVLPGATDENASPTPATPETGGRPRLSDEEFANEVGGIIAQCRRNGSLPVLVSWPLLHQLTQAGDTPKQRTLRHIAQTENLPFVDLPTIFRSRGDTTWFVDVLHASPAGCRAVADALEPVLRSLLARK